MHSTATSLEEQLKEHGFRMTSQRQRLLQWIASHTGPFTARDLHAAHRSIDLASAYRTIEVLAQLDAIHPALVLRGEQYYEVHTSQHHHHVVCTVCGKSACIRCTVQERSIPGFTNIHHTMTATSLCTACAAKQA